MLDGGLLCINVANLPKSLAACQRRGGKVVCPVREMSSGRMAVIRDPGCGGGLVRAGRRLSSFLARGRAWNISSQDFNFHGGSAES